MYTFIQLYFLHHLWLALSLQQPFIVQYLHSVIICVALFIVSGGVRHSCVEFKLFSHTQKQMGKKQ